MKRECTDAENRILKECKGDILTKPEICRAKFRSILVPMVLGFIAGLGLGVLIMLRFSVTVEAWAQVIVIICATVMVEVFVLVWEILGFRKKRNRYLPGDKFWINEGTVLKYIKSSPKEAYLFFAEDGVTDDRGNPCCIIYPALADLDIAYGERILLVYSDNGAYIPLKVTERTQFLVRDQKPAYFDEVDWNEAIKLPHPLVLDLDKESFHMNDKDTAEFAKKISKYSRIRMANWVGVIMFDLLILIILGLLFIGLVAGEIIKEFRAAIVVAALFVLIWMFLTFIFAQIVFSGRIRRIGKIQYKKKVMFHSIKDSYENSNYKKYISVYEYVNDVLELVPYPVNINVCLPKDMSYGKFIYKYSIDKISCAQDLNYFAN